MSDVTRILSAIEQGDAKAADELLPLVYEELRRLARLKMSQELPGQTLQATALVHEAYIRLVGSRRKKSIKYGGGRKRIYLNDAVPASNNEARLDELIALDEALEKLSTKDKVKADLVKLRYFAGLTCKQAAEVLGISHNTADQYWACARSWLRLEITKGEEASQS